MRAYRNVTGFAASLESDALPVIYEGLRNDITYISAEDFASCIYHGNHSNVQLYAAREFAAVQAPAVGSGAKPQHTNALVHIDLPLPVSSAIPESLTAVSRSYYMMTYTGWTFLTELRTS